MTIVWILVKNMELGSEETLCNTLRIIVGERIVRVHVKHGGEHTPLFSRL
jgi:hypothetical protein